MSQSLPAFRATLCFSRVELVVCQLASGYLLGRVWLLPQSLTSLLLFCETKG